MRRTSWFATMFALFGCGCTSLPDIAANTCGNGVVEAHEDCDANDAYCGAPGSAHACRFVCDPNENPPVSSCDGAKGYVCALEGICQKPSGTFQARDPIKSQQLQSVTAGDVDGDGIDDVVTMNSGGWLSEQYFELGGALGPVAGFQTLAIPPVVAQLTDGDSIADIVHMVDFAVGVLRGTQDRKPEPVAYSSVPVKVEGSYYFSLEAKRPDPNFPFEASVATQQEILALAGNQVSNVIPETLLFSVPYSPGQIVPSRSNGQLPVGDLDERPNSPCDEFVFAKANDTYVSVYTPCSSPIAFNHDPDALPKVSLSGGAKVGETVLLTRLNGDSHLDLVIAAKSPDPKKADLYAAYGVGNGSFHSDPGALPATGNGDGQAVLIYPGAPTPLRDAGDLNGDKIADFVFKSAIAQSVPANCALKKDCWFALPYEKSWSLAQVVDLNANGALDVVAIRAGDRYLDFLDGNGFGLFTTSSIALSGNTDRLAIGDFDGDFIGDIALNEIELLDPSISDDGLFRNDSLSVLFGRPFGSPDPPVSMGKLGQIDSITVGRYTFLGYDATSDITALSTYRSSPVDDGHQSASLFRGDSNRQLQSPFALAQNTSTEPDRGYVQAVGHFNSDEHLDIAALAIENKTDVTGTVRYPRIWLLPSTGDASLETTTAKRSTADLRGADIDLCTALPVVANIDQQGTDELLLFGRPPSSKVGGRIAIARVDVDTGAWTLDPDVKVVPDLTFNGTYASRYACGSLLLGDQFDPKSENGEVATQVQVLDVDGDSNPEIITLSGDASDKPDSGRQLSLFSMAPFTGIPTPLALPQDVKAKAFVVLNADSDSGLEVIVVNELGVYLAQLDLENNAVIDPVSLEPDAPSASPGPLLGIFAGSLLGAVAGDFNGDRIVDVVIAREGGVRLWEGQALAP